MARRVGFERPRCRRAEGELDLHDLQRLRRHVERCPKTPPSTRLALATAGAVSPRLHTVADAEGVVLLELAQLLS